MKMFWFSMAALGILYPVEVDTLSGRQKLTHRPFLKQGEYLKFKVSYLGVTGGYGVLETIPDPDNNRVYFHIRAWTTPFVSTIYTLLLDNKSITQSDTLHTLYYKEDKIERNLIRPNTITVFPQKRQFVFAKNLNTTPPLKKTVHYTNRGYDVIASFYLTRCLDLSEDEVIWFTSFFRDQIHETRVKIEKRERIRTKYGTMDTVVIIPKMKFRGLFMNKGDIIIYLSDDEYLCPVLLKSKLSVGFFKAKLVERFPLPPGWENPGKTPIENLNDLEKMKAKDKKQQAILREKAAQNKKNR